MEAEVVTADGDVKVANACSNPDLFWALKGGGGGFGVVTRVTLRTHALREFLGRGVRDHQGVVRRALPAPHLEDYRILRTGALQSALGPSSLVFAPGGVLSISIVLQGLDQQQAEATWGSRRSSPSATMPVAPTAVNFALKRARVRARALGMRGDGSNVCCFVGGIREIGAAKTRPAMTCSS